jgi:hypothetical protein
MSRKYLTVGVALVAAAGLAVACAGPRNAAQPPAAPAALASDQIGWETFAQIMAPAGNPKTTNVEFETWASDDDIYGSAGPHWPLVGAAKVLHASQLGAALAPHPIRVQVINPADCVQNYSKTTAAAAHFPKDGCIGEEVRRNWGTYQYIVSNNLYSRPGLVQAFAHNLKVDLPADAVELKGNWVKVPTLIQWLKDAENLTLTAEQVRGLYYTNTATDSTGTAEFALVSVHFSTKQQKNWVWADFEHELNPGRCDDIGCKDSFGATTAVMPAHATGDAWKAYPACAKSPALQKMFADAGLSAVWSHYCLKGSQTDFVDANKQPIKLGNSVIEAINAGVPINQSSCISCHAYASFDKAGTANFAALKLNAVGEIDQKNLKGFLTNDFIWGNTDIP